MGLFEDIFGGRSETTQERVFSREGRQALQGEVPLFQQIFPLISMLQTQALRPSGEVLRPAMESGAQVGTQAAQRAGLTAGFSPEALGDLLTVLEPGSVEFDEILAALRGSIRGQIGSVVPPALAPGLRPGVETSSVSTPSPFAIATGLIPLIGVGSGPAG